MLTEFKIRHLLWFVRKGCRPQCSNKNIQGSTNCDWGSQRLANDRGRASRILFESWMQVNSQPNKGHTRQKLHGTHENLHCRIQNPQCSCLWRIVMTSSTKKFTA